MKRHWDVLAIISTILAVGGLLFWANSWNRDDIQEVRADVKKLQSDLHQAQTGLEKEIQTSAAHLEEQVGNQIEDLKEGHSREIEQLEGRVNCVGNRLSRIEGALDRQFKNKIVRASD